MTSARPRSLWLSAALILAAGLAVYWNSFQGALLFDDLLHLTQTDRLHRLWPLGPVVTSQRPVVDLTLAVNYALHGERVWGYHLVNLLIHLASALLLFGIVRRTLLSTKLQGLFARIATPLALTTALLWLVHPLQTQAVTYIIQRGESMMGVFYLLTLYAAMRRLQEEAPGRGRRWTLLAIVSCALGMACKPVMVTAPLMALLYDRAFRSGSFTEALRKSKALYAGLAATWLVLAGLLALAPAGPTAGFGMDAVTPAQYAATQPGVILHYLRLAFWPRPQCFDYVWPMASRAGEVIGPAVVLLALLGATAWAWRRRPMLGFLGAWFFLILAPTSSIMPIADACVEHRMYLPLAAVVMLTVLGVFVAGRWFIARLAPAPLGARLGRDLALLAAVAAVGGLGYLAHLRNLYYTSALGMWRDVARLRPANPRAHYNIGVHLMEAGQPADAIPPLREAIRLAPRYAEAYKNLGTALGRTGRYEEALANLREGLRLQPDDAQAEVNCGDALRALGRRAEAMDHYRRALQLRPTLSLARERLADSGPDAER